MTTMRAAVLREFGRLEVADVERPVPGPGEVLVRVRACGICGTDLKIVSGAYAGTWPPALPFIIGHEWSGEVAALGPDTERSGLRPGDRVVAENHTGCASCPMCRAGRYNLCERVREPGFKLYGHTAPGALAEYAVRPAVALHRVPARSARCPRPWSTRGRSPCTRPAGPAWAPGTAWPYSAPGCSAC